MPALAGALLAACAPASLPTDPVTRPDAAHVAPMTQAAPPPGPVAGQPCWVRRPVHDPAPEFAPDSPVGATLRFYRMHQPHAGAGVPEAGRLDAYRPLLTQPLLAALERARRVRDAAVASAPDEKPPYVEGALFASLFEGYTDLQPITLASEGGQASVRVCFAYADRGGRTEWTDTVVLHKQDGAWRIDDVLYGGQWDFANTGSLRRQLPAE